MKKKVWSILLILTCAVFALCGFAACGEEPEGGRELTGIAITHAPDKTNYLVGEKFVPDGMVVEAKYSDNTQEAVTNYTYAPNGELKKTDTKITVTYEGKTATQAITVSEVPAVEVVKIEVTKKPAKLVYFVGDQFDKAGMEVTAYYSDETSEVVTEYFLNVTTLEEAGEKEIVVTYNGLTDKFTVTVNKPKLTGIEITAQPIWTLYNIGEHFSPAGMEVVASYENDTTKKLTAQQYTYEDKELAATDTAVVISYEEEGVIKTASVTIHVEALVLSSIVVEQQPYNTEYSAGDLFNADGLVVYYVYNGNDELKRFCDDWQIVDAKKPLTDQSSEVTVKSGEFTAKISITMVPKHIFEAEAFGFEVAEGADTSKLAISRGMEYGNVKSTADAVPDLIDWSMVSGTGFLNAQYSDLDVNAFVLDVTAESAAKATILIRIAERGYEPTLGKIPLSAVLYSLQLNGSELAIDEHSYYEHDLMKPRNFDMQEIVVARDVDLVAGKNIVKLGYQLKMLNVDYIAIRTTAPLTLTAEAGDKGHAWSDWTVTTLPTAEKEGEMYRYCPTCCARETVVLPKNLEDGAVYTKGESREATTYLAGTQTYTYDGKQFTVYTESAKGVLANNVFDLEDAELDSEYNGQMGIPVPGIDKAVNAKGVGAYKFNVGGGGDNGGGKFTYTIYSSIEATALFGIHVARNNTRCLNAAFNFRLTVNDKIVCLDPNMYCGTQDGTHNGTVEAYAKENEGWKSNGANWKDWIYIVCGTFDLTKGKNVIVVEVLGSPFTNVDDIRLQAATDLVTADEDCATTLTVKSQPEKTDYFEGEHFDPKGLVLETDTKGGAKREVKTYTYSPAGKLSKDVHEIVIEAEGQTVKIPITVEAVSGSVQSLEIEKPEKLTYKAGEAFDPTGMVVYAVYENGSRELTAEEYEAKMGEPEDGKAIVTVTFEEVSATFEVTVLMRNIFEAEAFEAENTKDLRREYEYNVDFTPSGMGYAARPQKTGTYTFHVFNPGTETVEAELAFSFGQTKNVADAFSKLTVNGTEVAMQNVGISVSGYFTWTETATAATVKLETGDNVFVLTIGKSRVNFDYVALYASADLFVTACKDGHSFTDWNLYQEAAPGNVALAYRYCPHCMIREELSIPYSEFSALEPVETAATEYVRGTKTYDYKGMTLVVTNGDATGEAKTQEFQYESLELADIGSGIYESYGTGTDTSKEPEVTYVDINNKGVTATLHFTASQKATVKLIIRAGAITKGDLYPARILRLDVNDVRIPMIWNATLTKCTGDSDPRGKNWNAWDDVTVAEFEVEEGENTLVISNFGGAFARVDSIKLVSAATITAAAAE